MVQPPSRGKPPFPGSTEQLRPGPLVEAPKVPDMGTVSMQKFKPGKWGGRILRVGKK
jgi:hypothetical protein